MGKVKDEAPASKASKPARGGSVGGSRRRLAQFLGNLVRADLYKPMQGRQARLFTGLALAVIVALGVWRLFESLTESTTPTRFGVPAAAALVLGWLIFRVVQYPPFVEFLIATEAEMNKVSWTRRDDLYRATVVVLVTVALMTLFLLVADVFWGFLLQLLGVLKYNSGDAFGSSVG
jgi:preprotein translocase subunit SecE